LLQSKENKKYSENQINEIKSTVKRALQEKEKFIHFIKNIFEMLSKCEKIEEFGQEKEKIINILTRNITNSELNNKINYEFDFRF
jgi:hypothetical protein